MSDFAYPLHEECGVFGIYDRAGTEDVAAAAYSALYALQHRGQESCGIAVNDDGVIVGHRDLGLVNEVFTPAVLASVSSPTAHMATGHVRYATAGSRVRANAQPMIVRHGRGTMALCHNGNLVNAPKLRRKLEMSGSIFHGTSDTEVIAYLLTQNRLLTPNIEMAVSRTMDDIEGAYSLVIMTHTKLIAARDPNGFRPLCIGELPNGNGYAFASESCALDAAGASLLRDVEPGEIVVADTRTGELRSSVSGIDMGAQLDGLLNSLSGGGEVQSFTSAENTEVSAVQFALQTTAITAPAPAAQPEPAAVTLTFWQKLLKRLGLYKG